MQTTLISPLTSNAKLGKGVATSYRPVGDSSMGLGTCPSKCPLLPANGGACYTRKFLVDNQQRNSNLRNDPLDRLIEKGAKFVRLHTSGDFYKGENGATVLDSDYLSEVVAWSRDHADVTVWTYTHDISKFVEKEFTYKVGAFSNNLHIVASCDSIEEKNLANSHGFRSARVIDKIEDKLEDETFCPYDLAKHEGKKPSVNCKDCTLCFNPKHRKNIAFLKQK